MEVTEDKDIGISEEGKERKGEWEEKMECEKGDGRSGESIEHDALNRFTDFDGATQRMRRGTGIKSDDVIVSGWYTRQGGKGAKTRCAGNFG